MNAYLTLATPDDGRRAWELVVRRLGLEAEYLRSERAAALRGSGSHILHELGTVRAQLARAVIAGDTAKAEPLRGRRYELEELLAGYLAAGFEAPDAQDGRRSTARGYDARHLRPQRAGRLRSRRARKGPRGPGRHSPPASNGVLDFVVTAEQARLVDLGPALAYTEDSAWRNRGQFVTGRAQIIEFLRQKWQHELDHALCKELWGFRGNRIAIHFQYECHDPAGQWWRSYGNELWEFTGEGLMNRREASINDIRIDESERRIFGPRPAEQRGAPLPIH